MIRGGCLCGGVRYEISGELSEICFCHCQMCRRLHGTPFGSYAAVHPQQRRYTSGEELITRYQSSAEAVRIFCSRCGSKLAFENSETPDEIWITVGTFDDDPGIHTIMKDVLSDLGYSVRAFGIAKDAVEFYRMHSSEVDVVILDVVMPDDDGVSCYRQLKEINAGVRAIVTTGYGTGDDVDHLLKEGATAFIPKPLDFTHLSHLIYKTLNVQRQ